MWIERKNRLLNCTLPWNTWSGFRFSTGLPVSREFAGTTTRHGALNRACTFRQVLSGIGGPQTGVYPLATPGGWQLIGRHLHSACLIRRVTDPSYYVRETACALYRRRRVC
ncbi:hypothetical protein DMI62_19705 [Escherichia coli]|nr:hypothetical protein [Escherichia coli]